MPLTRRSRTIGASVEDIWATVSDPHHMPRWWPRVERVEGVDEDGFTQVMRSKRGRAVRLDFSITEKDPPRICRWQQQIEGTPFDRILRRSELSVELDDDGAATRVTLGLDQALAGSSRFGGMMVRRAARSQLDEALDGLERIHG